MRPPGPPTLRRPGSDPRADEVSGHVLDAAIHVHTALGSGLLERIYHTCLAGALRKRGLDVRCEVSAPVVFDGERYDGAYRIDLLVENCVVVEVKAVHMLDDVHRAQILSYLALSGAPVGLLINFRAPHLRDGIERFVPPRRK